MAANDCYPGARPFFQQWFHECIYSTRDVLGFWFGMVSIACWMVATLPQFITNIRNQSAEALSAWFLAQWLLGDTFNLIGCLLNGDQLATQLYTAMYFICADVVMVMQYIYYAALQRRRERVYELRRQAYLAHRAQLEHTRHLQRYPAGQAVLAQEEGQNGDPQASSSTTLAPSAEGHAPKKYRVVACLAVLLVYNLQDLASRQAQALRAGDEAVLLRQGRSLLALGWRLADPLPPWARVTGTVLGYASSGLYLSSRLSQIYRNLQRRSAEGLSLAMFMCAISANTLYGAGVLLRSHAWRDVVSAAPWLLGSLGTVALDCIILTQSRWYAKRASKQEEEAQEPLLTQAMLEHAHLAV